MPMEVQMNAIHQKRTFSCQMKAKIDMTLSNSQLMTHQKTYFQKLYHVNIFKWLQFDNGNINNGMPPNIVS
jgi:hypothetical protein